MYASDADFQPCGYISSECGSAKKFRQCPEIVKNVVTKEVSLDILLYVPRLFNLKNMETQTIESKRQELTELEAKLDEAVIQYRQLKEKIKACPDDESDEALQLGMAEFNLFNYMDMLDDEISMLKSQLGIEN